MQRTPLALIAPPIAVYHYGAASPTAAPIGVFWFAGIVSIFYGLTGGILHVMGVSWIEILLGAVMWAIASVWARLVIGGVQDDFEHRADSTLDHQVTPKLDEKDPLKEAEQD